jgi:hypothetical protein
MDSGEGKSHKPAHRTHMRTGRSVWRGLTTTTGIMRQFDSSGARRAQRLVEDPRAGYDPGLEFANRAFESLRLSVPGVTSPT